jgi:GxxExxY protein
MDPEINELTVKVIGAAIEVHRELGPGLLESAYEAALTYELTLRNIRFEAQKAQPIRYKGLLIETGYRIDILVDGKVVLELQAVEAILPIHEAQLITYLKLSQCRIGLLINFNVSLLKQGIKRLAV